MTTPNWFQLLILSGALISPTLSWAYDFDPTPSEFAAWPPYCQARYGVTNIGSRSVYANAVSPTARENARKAIGVTTWDNVHHFCASMSYLNRARLAPNAKERKEHLRNAHNNIMYSFTRTEPGLPLYGAMVITLATIEKERGNPKAAIDYLTAAMEATPSDPQIYSALAILYRDLGDLAQARASLERGIGVVGGRSIEMHYNLGLICLELGDVECAMEHAQVAYADGYPFPGLKKKLASIGRWPE